MDEPHRPRLPLGLVALDTAGSLTLLAGQA